jgi:hypothetical protein
MGLKTDRDYFLPKLIHKETYKGLVISAILNSIGGMTVMVHANDLSFNLWTGDNIIQARKWIDTQEQLVKSFKG